MPQPPESAENPYYHDQNRDKLVLANGREVQLATFNDRTWARSSDIVNVCLFGLAGFVISRMEAPMESLDIGWNDPALHEFVQGVNLTLSLWVFFFLFIYETVGIVASGRTFGKRAIRIRVVTHSNGETPSYKNALLRSLIPNTAGAAASIIAATIINLRHPGLAGLAVWMLIYLSAIQNEDRRGWHDKIAGTVVIASTVVIEDPTQQPNKPSSSTLPETTEQKPTQSWGMVSDHYTKKPPQNNKPDNPNPT